MKKITKVISLVIALTCLVSGCVTDTTKANNNTKKTAYYLEKQETANAPFGINIEAYYNPDGQVAKIETNHPEFPNQILFNYDNQSKLQSIDTVYGDETKKTRIAEFNYTKSDNGVYEGKAEISSSVDAYSLVIPFLMLDSCIDDLYLDSLAYIYHSTFDIVSEEKMKTEMADTTFMFENDLGNCICVVRYSENLELKESAIKCTYSNDKNIINPEWNYKKTYNDNGQISEWVLGLRKVAFQYDKNSIKSTRYYNGVETTLLEKTYKNEKLVSWERNANDGNKVTSDIEIINETEKAYYVDSNGNQVGETISVYNADNQQLSKKTLRFDNKEVRDNITANADEWAYEATDFPKLETITHIFTWKAVENNNN